MQTTLHLVTTHYPEEDVTDALVLLVPEVPQGYESVCVVREPCWEWARDIMANRLLGDHPHLISCLPQHWCDKLNLDA